MGEKLICIHGRGERQVCLKCNDEDDMLEAQEVSREATAYAAGMERAAKVCEERAETHERNSKSRSRYMQETLAVHKEEDRHCAAAIRAEAQQGESKT